MAYFSTPSLLFFLRKVLLHTFLIWVIFNLCDCLIYLYNVKFDLAYTINRDGSLISPIDRFINHNLNQPLLSWLLLFAFFAEANFVVNFKGKSLFRFLAGSLLSGIAGATISLLFTSRLPFYPIIAQLVNSALSITAYIGAYAILYNFFQGRYREVKLRQQKSASELHLLKAQINPHFFFNTLNNIYGLALNENASRTAAVIELLSDMLRYNMNGIREDFIRVETELTFLKNYISLQQLRTPATDNIELTINIQPPAGSYQIAPMLLIPLIENAWRYGISNDHNCFIDIEITFNANQLVLVTKNSVFPTQNINHGSGLGIKNVTERLNLIYPGEHSYLVEEKHEYYQVTLTVNLK